MSILGKVAVCETLALLRQESSYEKAPYSRFAFSSEQNQNKKSSHCHLFPAVVSTADY